MSPSRALFRQALRDSRTRTLSFALLFAFAVGTQGPTYNAAYPTVADRMELARTFGSNTGTRLLYGTPHDLLTTGGWLSWRLGILPVFAALWGLFGAVRALRAEEESGRQELVLAGVVGRGPAYRAAMAAVGAGALALWLVTFLATLPAKVDVAGAAYLALAFNSLAFVYAGVGALTSQLAPTRRGALGLGGAALAVGLVLRMVADTSEPLDWLRWLTPFGWAEELRPFVGAQPALLVPLALLSAALVTAAGRISERRDVGAGLLPARDTARPDMRGLSSPDALALREQRGSLAAWLIGCSATALLLGVLSATASEGISDSLNDQFRKIGTPLTSAEGFLGLEFLFLILAICLLVCFQLAGAREEEAEQRLETLLSLPVGRRRWLGGRLGVALLAAAAVAMAAAFMAWVGAASAGAGVSLGKLLEAGVNCLPIAFLFLGLGVLAYALVPRASNLIAFGLVGVSFLWDTVLALADVPSWVLDISPFHHVALVPAQDLDVAAALVMAAIGVVAGGAALAFFQRRDLISG